ARPVDGSPAVLGQPPLEVAPPGVVGVAVAFGLGAGMVVGKPRAQLIPEREFGLTESQVHSFLLETGKARNLSASRRRSRPTERCHSRMAGEDAGGEAELRCASRRGRSATPPRTTRMRWNLRWGA